MSFRIELASKEGIFIYLVVINDVINVNFETADPADKYLAAQMRERFTHLLSAHASLEHLQNMVRGEDAEHIKRHHGIKRETQIVHIHYSFDQDITPELLEHFFNQLIIAQKSPEHPSDQFITEDQVKQMVKTFGIFYAEFKGSKFEKECLKERELTKQEKDSLIQHAKQKTTSHLSKRDVSQLEECGISLSEIPKPSQQPKQDSPAPSFRTIDINEIDILAELIRINTQIRLSGFRSGFFQSQPNSPAEKPNISTGFGGFKPGFLMTKPNSSKDQASETMESYSPQ
ncbi:hypothetical protein OQJ19_13950 [Fluoribacter gormanii]|uniref:hypothetical protein n=1 Tax=Fluoribacter gormanii TaxID=464 RepID=UPI002244DB66|nr:hypothetical protein [Fluoribacter gormanii]MCW8471740.1 hypothetical protein [Fluoribacter gormanii]